MQADPTPSRERRQAARAPDPAPATAPTAGDPLAALESSGLPARALRLARVLFRPPFGRSFDPDDPVFLARPAVRSACIAAGVPVGALVAWPGQERLAAVAGVCLRTVRDRMHELVAAGAFEVHPLPWPNRRPGRLYVRRATAPGTRVAAYSRQDLPVGQEDLPVGLPVGGAGCRPSHGAFEVSVLDLDLRKPEEREQQLAPVLRPSFPAKAEATAEAPAPPAAVPETKTVYLAEWSDRFGPGGFVDAADDAAIRALLGSPEDADAATVAALVETHLTGRDRDRVRALLARPGVDAATAAAMVETYFASGAPHWHGQGFPLRGVAVDSRTWIVAGRSGAPVRSSSPRSGKREQQQRHYRDGPDDLVDVVVKPLDPETAAAAARLALDRAVAAVPEACPHFKRHGSRIDYCGSCQNKIAGLEQAHARQLADLDRAHESRAGGAL